METFQNYATAESKNYFEKIMNSSHAVSEVERIRNIILSANEIGGFNVNATYWFDTISKKLGLIKKTENFIIKNLNHYIDILEERFKKEGSTTFILLNPESQFVKFLNQRNG